MVGCLCKTELNGEETTIFSHGAKKRLTFSKEEAHSNEGKAGIPKKEKIGKVGQKGKDMER